VRQTRRPNEWSSCSRKHFMQICPVAMSLVLPSPRGKQRPTFHFRALLPLPRRPRCDARTCTHSRAHGHTRSTLGFRARALQLVINN